MRLTWRTTIRFCVSAVLFSSTYATAFADERPVVLFADVGVASIGHADSEQGKAPIAGGGAAFHVMPRLVIEGDVHGTRVERVFGRDDHVFTELTATGSLLFRSSPEGRTHLIAGGGLGVQRAHIEFTEPPPVGHIDRTETIRLLHGRAGVEWDASERVVIGSDAVFWFGAGLDWVVGGRVRFGYRF